MSDTRSNLFASLRGTRLIVAVFLTLTLLVAVGRGAAGAYVEILWQNQAGYASAFWTRIAWEWGLRLVAGLAVGLLVFVNLKIASTTLGGIQIRRRFGNLEISEQIPKQYVTWGMIAAATVLGLWFGAALPVNLGRRLLFLTNSAPWGLVEPVLDRDVSFYIFWVPVLVNALVYAMTTIFLVFTLATAGYAATGALAWARGRVEAHPLARAHLGILLGVFFVLLAARLWLGRHLLLLDGSSAVQGIFGYADAEARLPALQTLTVISVGAAAGMAWGAWKNRPAVLLGSFTSVLLGTILIGEFYPSLVQSFRVEPNELERESAYIEYNLDFTRRGFGLDELDRRAISYGANAPLDWSGVEEQFAGLPVWNRRALLDTYRELEAFYPYYEFTDVTIDRYPTPNGPVQMALSVRQVNPGGIQDQNWQNLHVRELYVAGVGAVASLAAEHSPQRRPPMALSGLEQTVSESAQAAGLDLELTRPRIFFGTGVQQPYAVVSPGPGQYLAADGSPGVPGIDYPEGIPLGSTFRTAILAWRFQDANLLFASELTDDSRFIFRRRAIDRAEAVAPFLHFPEAPYPVIADGRVVWVLEGFTGTGWFPLASVADFQSFRSGQFRYARNSFKVTVDAVTGQIDLYRVPAEDPLADVYERTFPGLFKPIDEMPAAVRDHVRYSRQLLDLQSRLLLQYHQETAAAFHGQQDMWAQPQELAENTSPVAYRPEYGIYRLPDEEEARYHLTTVFVPAGRQNLTAMLVGRTNERGVPELILIDVPAEEGAPGPRQVEAEIEQDPDISQQFTLWRSGGSEVWTGHLHIVPVGERLVYMEPVFLAAEEDAIPSLMRYIVSDGVSVVMSETREEAIAVLSGRPMGSGTTTAGDARPGTTPAIGAPGGAEWPTEALDMLNEAESAARAGDWARYGEALERLRRLLEELRGG